MFQAEEDEDDQSSDAIDKSSGQNLAIEAPSSTDEQCDKIDNDTVQVTNEDDKPETNGTNDNIACDYSKC
jgi:hypothetical protein